MMPQAALKTVTITSFGNTDCGLVRTKNEDNFLVDDDRQVYAVADGLGGIPNGEKASMLAMQMIGDYYDDAVLRGDIFLKDMFEAINSSVYNEGHRYSPDLGMATTLTVAQILGNTLNIGHVGDSALYLYRAGTLRQITAEHTLRASVCKNLSAEEQANVPEALSHTLTRCIGHRPTIEVDMIELTLQPGDRLLLCTDGITKYVEQEFVEKAFAVSVNPDQLVHHLINAAHERGGMDNATAVAMFVKGAPAKIFGLSAPQVGYNK